VAPSLLFCASLHSLRRPPPSASALDVDKVLSTLRQFVRDWAEEGRPERDAAAAPTQRGGGATAACPLGALVPESTPGDSHRWLARKYAKGPSKLVSR